MIPKKLYRRTWSRRALVAMISSLVVAIVLSAADGVVMYVFMNAARDPYVNIARTVIYNFRFLAEQMIYASTILFVGSRFFEQRTLITVAFDTPDSQKMAVMGPDENGFIWVGRKYPSRIEGETAVAALKTRIMQSNERNFGEYGW